MAWDEEMTEIVRTLIGDTDEDAPINSDDNLLRVLMVSAFQVVNEVDFRQDYAIAILAQTIAPDPTLTATKDDSFVNLVTMKAACILDRSSAILAASRAISVRDNGAAVDLRGVFGANLQLLEKGWCAVYENSKLEYESNSRTIAGAAIMTPFRLYSQSNSGASGYLVRSRDNNSIY